MRAEDGLIVKLCAAERGFPLAVSKVMCRRHHSVRRLARLAMFRLSHNKGMGTRRCGRKNRHDLTTSRSHGKIRATRCPVVYPGTTSGHERCPYCCVMMMDDGLNLELYIDGEPLQPAFALLISSIRAHKAFHWWSACLTLILNVAWEAGV